MAASSEIQYRIGGDTSALSAAFVKAASVAEAAGKQIQKKLGMQDAFKASAIALGLSVDKIATKVAEFFSGGSKDDWEAAANAAERTARIMEDSTNRRLSSEQQIRNLQLKIESEQQNAAPAPRLNAPTAIFSPFTGKMVMQQIATETEAEAAKRAAEARERIKTDEAKIAALKEAQAQSWAQIVKAEEQLEETGMSNERRHRLLLEDAEALKKDRDAAIAANKEWMPLQLAYTQKLISAAQVELDINRGITAEKNKQADLVNKLFNAAKKAGGAATDLATAREEAMNFTLDEAALGERGSKADQEKAERILLYEETARRLRDQGPGASLGAMRTGKFNERGDPMFQPLTSKYYQSAAEDLRKGFSGMKAEDREPFAGLESRMQEAVAELVSLNAKLDQE